MKIAFISNYLTHHQLPFCNTMIRLCDIDFVFIATEPIDDERVKLGYDDLNMMYSFVLRAYESKKSKLDAKKICDNYDILIYGSTPDFYIRDRLKKRKLTVKYGERFFKTPFTLFNTPRRVMSMFKHNMIYQNRNHYILCASAFMTADCHMFRCFEGKAYKWGYFPETKKYEDIRNLLNKKKKKSILWAGRIIDWKHPEAAIEIAQKLKSDNQHFELLIIGNGADEEKIKEKIKENKLQNEVKMLGAMSPDIVREYMEKSQIFLFTSDRQEGWGAVLNEAMNSGCSVVASNMIGSVPYLIDDGKNGLIFRDQDWNDLYLKVKLLLNDDNYRYSIARNAYHTIVDLWCAEVAVDRLIKWLSSILNNEEHDYFKIGPCSKAEIVKNSWYENNRGELNN